MNELLEKDKTKLVRILFWFIGYNKYRGKWKLYRTEYHWINLAIPFQYIKVK